MQRSEAFREIQALEAAELAHVQAGHTARVFYHPGRSANVHLNHRGEVTAHGLPAGYALDVAAWEAAGRTGPAPLIPAPDEAAEEAPPPVEAPAELPQLVVPPRLVALPTYPAPSPAPVLPAPPVAPVVPPAPSVAPVPAVAAEGE